MLAKPDSFTVTAPMLLRKQSVMPITELHIGEQMLVYCTPENPALQTIQVQIIHCMKDISVMNLLLKVISLTIMQQWVFGMKRMDGNRMLVLP